MPSRRGREAAFARDFSDDAAREREEKARAFDQQHRFHLALLRILDLEQTGIIKLADEQDRLFSGRLGRQFQRHFVEAVSVRVRGRADINSKINVWLGLDRANAWIFE